MLQIEESTILELQDAMQNAKLTSRELVLYYFSRMMLILFLSYQVIRLLRHLQDFQV